MHAASVSIQAAWRGFAKRRQIAEMHTASISIQAAWRGFAKRRQIAEMHAAAISIQAAWRGFAKRRQIAQMHAAAISIQAAWRGIFVRRMLKSQRAAATAIQAAWRGALVRSRLQLSRVSATCVQVQAQRKHCLSILFCTRSFVRISPRPLRLNRLTPFRTVRAFSSGTLARIPSQARSPPSGSCFRLHPEACAGHEGEDRVPALEASRCDNAGEARRKGLFITPGPIDTD
jgi:hypothetical protein